MTIHWVSVCEQKRVCHMCMHMDMDMMVYAHVHVHVHVHAHVTLARPHVVALTMTEVDVRPQRARRRLGGARVFARKLRVEPCLPFE